ncbi:uncharacterized protein LOC142817978 [Rhipicephalus microplus]|uniref:uncharacterized protein LOC142774654 n=1 Tax=Rhipicephalus microplus TaxID=6941 RepID=UPI003F6CF380
MQVVLHLVIDLRAQDQVVLAVHLFGSSLVKFFGALFTCSAQWSLAPYVVKAGGYCQSSLTFLRSPSPGTHHNQEIFQERMAACAPALFQMMEEAPTKHTMELVVRVRDEGQREKAVQVAVLPFLCAHFKEDKNYLYQVFEEGTSITEKLAELPSTPTIIALGINMLK